VVGVLFCWVGEVCFYGVGFGGDCFFFFRNSSFSFGYAVKPGNYVPVPLFYGFRALSRSGIVRVMRPLPPPLSSIQYWT